ncbi:MAG: NAD(P)-dependent alcohol dehydrogenase [Proteobacteria bacterium]|nr:NAD(P)-dependent alcohol dehydrogenase [Pseudomonadota bacterium]
MKAVLFTEYGPPEVLRVEEVEKPVPGEGQVLVKVSATTVNRTDCATVRAKPFFMRLATGLFRPKKTIPGTEFAGRVEAVGAGVTELKPGDRVFGFDDRGLGAHAEYAVVDEENAVTVPEGMTDEQAAPSTEGAHYAYNFINKVELKAGDTVLVNGATGAIGSAAVQLLKHFEATVTAVCATKDIELVRSLGADRVIDYTVEDFTEDDRSYSFVFDTVGKSSFFRCRRLLLPGGVYLSSDLGYMAQNIYLPLITAVIRPVLGNRKTLFPMPVDRRASILLVRKLIEEGRFRAVIDRTYRFEEIVEAYRYVEKGEKTGNVVIIVAHQNETRQSRQDS